MKRFRVDNLLTHLKLHASNKNKSALAHSKRKKHRKINLCYASIRQFKNFILPIIEILKLIGFSDSNAKRNFAAF